MLDPEAYVRLTGSIVTFMKKYKSKDGKRLKHVAGAWHIVCINRGQTGQASETNQDWLDIPSGYNCVALYGPGFTGGDMHLW